MEVIPAKPRRGPFRRLAKFALLLLTIMAVNIGVMVFSYVRFGTYNYLKSGMGLMNIMVLDNDYVQIQYNPLSYIVNNDRMDAFIGHLSEKGYTQLPQEGGSGNIRYIFQKDEEQYAASMEEGWFVTRVRFEKNPIA